MGIAFKVKGIPGQMLWAVAAGRNPIGAAGCVAELLPTCPNTISCPSGHWGCAHPAKPCPRRSLSHGQESPCMSASVLHPLVAVGTRVAEHGAVFGEPCPAPSLAGTRVWDGCTPAGRCFCTYTTLPMNSSLRAVSDATQLQTCFAVSDN